MKGKLVKMASAVTLITFNVKVANTQIKKQYHNASIHTHTHTSVILKMEQNIFTM